MKAAEIVKKTAGLRDAAREYLEYASPSASAGAELSWQR
jgi:hypothetical protein